MKGKRVILRDIQKLLMRRGPLALALVLACGALSCRMPSLGSLRPEQKMATPDPAVPAVQSHLQHEMAARAGEQLPKTMDSLARNLSYPVTFKPPLLLKASAKPWEAMTELEGMGLEIAATAAGTDEVLPALMAQLSAANGWRCERHAPMRPPELSGFDAHVRFVEAVLRAATRLRDEAMASLSEADRAFMFDWTVKMERYYYPHFYGTDPQTVERFKVDPDSEHALNENNRARALKDLDFCTAWNKRVDWSKLVYAAQTLLVLNHPAFLESLEAACGEAESVYTVGGDLTGTIVYQGDSACGRVLIGGRDANSYRLDEHFALVIDLGGDDTYEGVIAASSSSEQAVSLVVDLGGDDTYTAAKFGLATGRLGLGILIDHAGDDVYRPRNVGAGSAMAGIGILCDLAGDDKYAGRKYTLGAAFCGLGLLVDRAGDDMYTSFGFSVGFGGPSGVGAVIDVAGDDSYQCGRNIPSGYNREGMQPRDSGYQYTAYGVGAGVGKRIFSQDAEQQALGLSGGVGAVIDIDGNDTYDTSNFSQATGYFFGVGLKMDLAGNDRHGAARYGFACGAHHGMGLFVDYAGKDSYSTTGPTYNGGCAWDYCVMLCIDAGAANDRYQLQKSAGLGRADHSSWGVFAEMGGNDDYVVPTGLGYAATNAVSAFLDVAGKDDYSEAAGGEFENRQSVTREPGGLFIDR